MIRLRNLRNQKGYSQKDIAQRLGITQQAYANYEREARQADYGTLNKLADLFDVSVDYILGRTDDPNQKQGETNIKYDEFSYAMYDEAKDLSEADKQRLLTFARMLKDSIAEEKKNNGK